jgi:UDP-N-acetylmuramoylalanine--D-glutamate ligase
VRELIHQGQLAGHNAVVVGAGLSGLAAARLLAALGASVRLLDQKTPDRQTQEALAAAGVALVVGEHKPSDFASAQMIVLSPGVNPHKLAPVLAGVPPQNVIAELELASWFVTEPIIAVTGTSGKTTTTSVIGEMLQSAGRKVFVGGNIGTPLSEYVLGTQRAEIVVLEVSSFQLMNVRSLKPHVAVLVSFAPNHLDWHETMEEYLAAKLSLFSRMTSDDLAVLPLSMKAELEARQFTKARRVYFTATERFKDSALIGAHNKANLEAAWLAAKAFGVDEDHARRAVAAYKPHGHRLQILGEKNGVTFVDDSKATTIDALMAAIDSFDAPIRLLAGGVFKGGDLRAVLPLLKAKVRSVGLFGASREVFEAAWGGEVPLFWEPTLEAAVRRLYAEAEPGEVILLSPATASFDAYKSYKARGDDFARVFGELT